MERPIGPVERLTGPELGTAGAARIRARVCKAAVWAMPGDLGKAHEHAGKNNIYIYCSAQNWFFGGTPSLLDTGYATKQRQRIAEECDVTRPQTTIELFM